MATLKKVSATDLFMGRLAHGADLLDEITQICIRENIELGRLEALGAVERARLAYYNQKTREYRYFTIDMPLEILNLTGNISIKEGQPMVHAHLSLADDAGHAYGGHLASGTIIFACEIVIQALAGPAFERAFDEETGLPLWRME